MTGQRMNCGYRDETPGALSVPSAWTLRADPAGGQATSGGRCVPACDNPENTGGFSPTGYPHSSEMHRQPGPS